MNRTKRYCPLVCLILLLSIRASPATAAELGGDDVLIDDPAGYIGASPAVDSAGNLYVATCLFDYDYGDDILVYRSTDGGTTWAVWATIADPDPAVEYGNPSLIIAEGEENLCFVAFDREVAGEDRDEVVVAHSPLDLAAGDFSSQTVALTDPGFSFYGAELCSDAVNQHFYYVFLVARGRSDTDMGVWYARSVNRGDTFGLRLRLTDEPSADFFEKPEIEYGFGGYLHAVWVRRSDVDGELLSHRRGTASGSTITSWAAVTEFAMLGQPGETITPGSQPGIAPSSVGNEVVAVCARSSKIGATYHRLSPQVMASLDQGATFSVVDTIGNAVGFFRSLIHEPDGDDWYLYSTLDKVYVQRTYPGSFDSWGAPNDYGDDIERYGPFNLAKPVVDPTRGHRLGHVWTSQHSPAPARLFAWDAQWFADPGYPNYEPGFPLDLPARPISPPGVADLDGDGDLEIFWGDDAGDVQVYDHDGTPHPGWPQAVPGGLSTGPVAAGDLNGDGAPEVAAGSAVGHALAWTAGGQLLWARDVDRDSSRPAYVCIGAMGPPYLRYVVAAAGDRLRFYPYGGTAAGVEPAPLGQMIDYPAAVGDIDRDGATEYVVVAGTRLLAGRFVDSTILFDLALPDPANGAVSLGDIDDDGDFEVLVPTVTGVMHAFDHAGAVQGGSWPYVAKGQTPLHSAAIAEIGVYDGLEVVFGDAGRRVFALNNLGENSLGYPVLTGLGSVNLGGPIVGVVWGSPDVIAGSADGHAWCWNNGGDVYAGWPKDVDEPIDLTPARGDVDRDGSTEYVFLSASRLLVVDVSVDHWSEPRDEWSMDRHDARRSGCADCPERMTTDVGPGQSPAAAIRFAAPVPNPLHGRSLFRYAVPARAQVRLEVFDLRGRKLATVHREESTPGEHVVVWEGDGDDGRALPSGNYLARLRVRGPGMDRELVRKLTVLR